MDRYIDTQNLENNRRIQDNDYKGGLASHQATNKGNNEEPKKQTGDSDNVVAAATGGGKGAAPRTPAHNGPCHAHQG